jgi:hypothetical protein
LGGTGGLVDLYTEATPRLRVSANGNVGIGNTSPTHKLRVEGTASVLGAATFSNTVSITGAATFSNTVAVTGDITVSKGLNANGSLGSDTQVLSSNGSSVYWADASSGEFTWQSYAPVNGAVSQNFTIPSGATEILVVFDGVIQTGTARPTIRLGDSGGIETSGYENVAVGSITDTDNTGFSLTGDDLGQHRGIAWLYKLADHKWSCTSLMYNYTERNQSFGIKSITTELTTVQVLSDDAGDDWDGGGTIYVGYK